MKRVTAPLLLAAAAACTDLPSDPVATSPRRLELSLFAAAKLSAAIQGRRTRGFEDEILRMEARVPGLGGVSIAQRHSEMHGKIDGNGYTTCLRSSHHQLQRCR